MLYSRVQLVTEPSRATSSSHHSMNAILQDTYDVHDYDDDVASNDATSCDNFYDAETEAGLAEVRLNMDPSMRLIEALETLREVITENTNVHGRRRRGRSSAANYGGKGDGATGGIKDDRLKIRKEKVGQVVYNLLYL